MAAAALILLLPLAAVPFAALAEAPPGAEGVGAIPASHIQLAAQTGDDDDIDDLIIQRERRAADRAKPATGSAVPETEDDLYVGNRPANQTGTSGAAQPPAAARAIKMTNCGTFWTGWSDILDPKTNPCPAGCEPGEKTGERRHKQGEVTLVDLQFQCYGVADAKKSGVADRPARPGRQPAAAAGKLVPESGRWNSLVTVSGPGFGKAERVSVVWYPNDDDSQSQAGALSATVRKRVGTDQIEIEMPRNAGGSDGAVVRVYVFMPQQLQPVLAGRFTIGSGQQPGQSTSTAAVDAAPLPSAPGRKRDTPVDDSRLNAPGPVIRAGNAVSVFAIKVEWQKADGAAGYVIHALEQGQTVPAKSREIPSSTAATPMSGEIAGLTPGFAHEVWVEARYPDKRTGRSEIRRAITHNPVNPKDLTATQVAPNAVQLKWTAIDGATHYIAEGSGLQRLQTPDPLVTIPNLPAGSHEWRVIAVYAKGVYNDLQPAVARLALGASGSPSSGDLSSGAVDARARYRISITGFRVDRASLDDPLQIDGKGDEVYVVAAVAHFERDTATLVRHEIFRSPVFGDKAGFPQATRVLAGSIGSSGGLRAGDVYPEPDPAISQRPATRNDLPLLVWEGELASGGNALLIAPSIWEWDDGRGSFGLWRDNIRAFMTQQFGAARAASTSARLSPLTVVNPGVTLRDDEHITGDRPIGLRRGTTKTHVFAERLVLVTREIADGELAHGPSGALPAGVIPLNFTDTGAHGGSDYTLYLKVERLP